MKQKWFIKKMPVFLCIALEVSSLHASERTYSSSFTSKILAGLALCSIIKIGHSLYKRSKTRHIITSMQTQAHASEVFQSHTLTPLYQENHERLMAISAQQHYVRQEQLKHKKELRNELYGVAVDTKKIIDVWNLHDRRNLPFLKALIQKTNKQIVLLDQKIDERAFMSPEIFSYERDWHQEIQEYDAVIQHNKKQIDNIIMPCLMRNHRCMSQIKKRGSVRNAPKVIDESSDSDSDDQFYDCKSY